MLIMIAILMLLCVVKAVAVTVMKARTGAKVYKTYLLLMKKCNLLLLFSFRRLTKESVDSLGHKELFAAVCQRLREVIRPASQGWTKRASTSKADSEDVVKEAGEWVAGLQVSKHFFVRVGGLTEKNQESG
jgi:hypothetical protein